MADLFDYLLWRGDLPMDRVPPNPVDTLILSELSYIFYDSLVDAGFQNPPRRFSGCLKNFKYYLNKLRRNGCRGSKFKV